MNAIKTEVGVSRFYLVRRITVSSQNFAELSVSQLLILWRISECRRRKDRHIVFLRHFVNGNSLSQCRSNRLVDIAYFSGFEYFHCLFEVDSTVVCFKHDAIYLVKQFRYGRCNLHTVFLDLFYISGNSFVTGLDSL